MVALGSGAVESAIRRVINLRLKGNGMFWTEENAESMLGFRQKIKCRFLCLLGERCSVITLRFIPAFVGDNEQKPEWSAAQ